MQNYALAFLQDLDAVFERWSIAFISTYTKTLVFRSRRKVNKMWSNSSSSAVKKTEEKSREEEEDNCAEKLNEQSFKIMDNHDSSNISVTRTMSFSAINETSRNNVLATAKRSASLRNETKKEHTKFPEANSYTVRKTNSFSVCSVHQGQGGCETSKKPAINGTSRRKREHFRNKNAATFSLRYVIYLTFSFLLCTTPAMIVLSIDILKPTLYLNRVVLNSCLFCPFVYCCLCPFILVRCLPGVKTSLSGLILSVYSTSD